MPPSHEVGITHQCWSTLAKYFEIDFTLSFVNDIVCSMIRVYRVVENQYSKRTFDIARQPFRLLFINVQKYFGSPLHTFQSLGFTYRCTTLCSLKMSERNLAEVCAKNCRNISVSVKIK